MSEVVNNGLSALTGLPIEDLISKPIIGAAVGQAALADVTLDFVHKLGFVEDKETGKLSTKLIEFDLNRIAIDEGEVVDVIQKVQVPPLSLVNIPNMTIDEISIEFSMEVKQQQAQTSNLGTTVGSESNINAEAQGGFGGIGFKAGASSTLSASVSYSQTNTRASDFSAKYNVKCVARQQPVSEGMGKLTQILASIIEPVQLS